VNFGSHVDGIVAISVALVNVGTSGEQQGRTYTVPSGRELSSAVTDALRQGSRRAIAPRQSELPAFVDLAEAVRPVFAAMDGGDQTRAATAANALLDRYRPSPILQRHDGQPWHLHFHGPEASDPTGWGGAVAVGLATVLGSEYADRLGICAAPACDRVFVDVSRNGTRRFCSEACQNRVKAAAHRARQRA